VTAESWRIRYVPQARRDLRRLDPSIRKRVVLAIERLAANDPRSDVRKISGADECRLRVGDWRVRFERDASTRQIIVFRVLPRGRAYDR
jgi:mRNA interferase RelE/StbE